MLVALGVGMNAQPSFVILFFFCENKSNYCNNYSVYWFVISFSDICVIEKGKYYVETDSSYMVVLFCLGLVRSEFD